MWSVYDNIGEIQWHLYGDGEISGDTGSGIYYYAPLSSTNTIATITATVHDSGQLGVDVALTKSVQFNIRIPTGSDAYWLYDIPLGPSGSNYIGGSSVFQPVITPTTVNFSNVLFRENIPEQTFPWPDRIHTYTRSSDDTDYFGVVDSYVYALDLVMPNVVGSDTVGDPLTPIDYLWNGSAYQDCTFDVLVPLEFQDENGNWVPFTTEHHVRMYSGATQSLQVEYDASDGGDAGDDMGPYDY
jgi:hypothetical protein